MQITWEQLNLLFVTGKTGFRIRKMHNYARNSAADGLYTFATKAGV